MVDSHSIGHLAVIKRIMPAKHPELSKLRQLSQEEQGNAWKDFFGHLQTRPQDEIIKELKHKLQIYERKHGMSACALQDKLCSGKIEPTKEIMEWSLAYKMYQSLSNSPCHGAQ
jgi:hypothetical protein